MKKILILLIPLLLTGCFGKIGSGYLTSTCTLKQTSKSLEEIITYKVDFKENVISTITLTKEYNNDSILSALKSEEKSYTSISGMKVMLLETNNTITYTFDMKKINDKNIIDKFKLKNNYNDFASELKKLGYVCK